MMYASVDTALYFVGTLVIAIAFVAIVPALGLIGSVCIVRVAQVRRRDARVRALKVPSAEPETASIAAPQTSQ